MSDSDNPQNGEKPGVRQGLEYLTDKEGPLYALVSEVKKSNEMAHKNMKLQRWSLIALVVNMLFLVFMTLVVLGTVGVLVDAKNTLTNVAHNVEVGVAGIKNLIESDQEKPEVVVDEKGHMTLTLPQVSRETSKGKAQTEKATEAPAAEAEDPDPVLKAIPAPKPKKPALVEQIMGSKSVGPAPRPVHDEQHKKVESKRVSIPINLEQLEMK